MSRDDAITEAYSTAAFIRDNGVNTVWIEPVLIVDGSDLANLWRIGKYPLIETQVFEELVSTCAGLATIRRGGVVGSPRIIVNSIEEQGPLPVTGM